MKKLALSLPLLLLAACGGKEACEDDSYACTEDGMLQHCHEGAWEDHEDCAAQGLVCDAEMGHCMEADDSGGMM